jgi:hypothetical protein
MRESCFEFFFRFCFRVEVLSGLASIWGIFIAGEQGLLVCWGVGVLGCWGVGVSFVHDMLEYIRHSKYTISLINSIPSSSLPVNS